MGSFEGSVEVARFLDSGVRRKFGRGSLSLSESLMKARNS